MTGTTLEDVRARLELWLNSQHIKLHAGEFTTSEIRSVKAVVGAVVREAVAAFEQRDREHKEDIEKIREAINPFVEFLSYMEAHQAKKGLVLDDREIMSIRAWVRDSPFLEVSAFRALRALPVDGETNG